MKERDPLGKRALFSGAERADPSPASTDRKGPLDVTVYCSSCHTRTRVSAADMVLSHLPMGAWVPWRKHPHLMKCPACDRKTWHSVSLVW